MIIKKEYIERDALQRCRFIQDEWGEWILAEDIINLPAADVRPVVLCRDCKCYRRSSFVDKHMECARSGFPAHPVDFCSFGEKREES